MGNGSLSTVAPPFGSTATMVTVRFMPAASAGIGRRHRGQNKHERCRDGFDALPEHARLPETSRLSELVRLS